MAVKYTTSDDGKKYTYNAYGKTYTLNFADGESDVGGTYRSDNVFRRGQKKHVAAAVQLALELGRVPTQIEYTDYLDKLGIPNGRTDGAYKNVRYDINAFFRTNGIKTDNEGFITNIEGLRSGAPIKDSDGSSGTDGEDAMMNAMDAYFRDQFSLQEGTSGKVMLDRLERGFTNQAEQDIALADAQYQQQALQQAQVVKSITDQIRSERMARLRSGMSEAQIANQDMQMLLANTNALNENAAMMNQGRLAGQANLNTARDQAYMQFLESSAVRGQVGAANYASSSSNPNYITAQRLYDLYGSNPTVAQKRQVYNNTMGIPEE
jgi:hypothetical protein